MVLDGWMDGWMGLGFWESCTNGKSCRNGRHLNMLFVEKSTVEAESIMVLTWKIATTFEDPIDVHR